MAFDRSKFALFFSMPLDSQDWSNLDLSHVKRVQMPLAFCDDGTCHRLRQHGISLSVRVAPSELSDIGAVAVRLHALRRHVRLDGAILDNEPEHPFNLRYGAPTWGQEAAWRHARIVDDACDVLAPLDIPVVSPGWTSRVKDYNWQEGLFPGEQTWLEITRGAYNRCQYNGFHWYSYDGTHYDLYERMRRTLHREQERRHRPLYINEVGVDRGTPVERMAVYIRLARLLEDGQGTPWEGAGERVELLAPFVSNGTGVHWNPGLLIRDPAAYAMLGQYLQGG